MTVAGKRGIDVDDDTLAATLQFVNLPVAEVAISQKAVSFYEDPSGPLVYLRVQGGRDSCFGDSGGLMYKSNANNQSILVNLTSYGMLDDEDSFLCGEEGSVSTYILIYHYMDWISQITGSSKDQFLQTQPNLRLVSLPGVMLPAPQTLDFHQPWFIVSRSRIFVGYRLSFTYF
ncbi:hypothetical protein IWQ61_003920 [Dispira simplex]|nr:hypothetical protein IWQ61_003920 [Dispira simplex]